MSTPRSDLYTTRAIANYFIRKGREQGVRIDPLKLQKLVYFAQGWHLAIHGRPLVDEMAEAWPYGPVFSSLYHQLKHYGRQPVLEPIRARSAEQSWVPAVAPDDRETRAILDRVWEVYGRLDGTTLSDMTHQKDGPWAETWQREAREGQLRGVDIPIERIQTYFEKVGLEARHRRTGA